MRLSIIIPIYNVELYLRKCVDSVLNQDIRDYEIILVDDGSTDSCPQICDEYANSRLLAVDSPLIRVIHQPNAGLSAARNSGIKIANGDYIMFVDSDDYIEPNVLGGLIAQMKRDNLDVLRYRMLYVRIVNSEKLIVNSEARIEYEVYNPYKSDPFKGNDYSEIPTDGVTFLNTRMSTACYAWAFVIRRELLEGCIFTPGIYFEDTDWTPRMLCKANRVASTNTIVYNYLIREGSITNAINRSKKQKVLADKMHLIATMQQQAVDIQKTGRDSSWFNRMIAATLISIIGMLSTDFYPERKSYLEQLRKWNVYPLQDASFKARLINISPKLAVELLHLKNGK